MRALAKAIVADIALYHEGKIDQVVRSGSTEPLQGPLAEGKRILAELAHMDEYPSTDPVEEAFAELVRSMRGG